MVPTRNPQRSGVYGGRFLALKFFSLHPNPGKIQAIYNDSDLFSVHDEKILSWDMVLDHGPTKQELLRYVDGQFAVVEMEGPGFLKAVASHAKNGIDRPWRRIQTGGVDALIVRGISDPAEQKQKTDSGDKNWRQYAARNAIHVVMLLIDVLEDKDFEQA